MKILLVIESLGLGGSEASLSYLLPEIRALGHDCHVAALWEPEDLAPALVEAGITVHRLRAGHRFNASSAAVRLARLCWAERFDVVHAKLFFSGQAVALSRAISPPAVRVVSFHNQEYEVSDPALTLRFRRIADRLTLPRLVDGFAALSTAVAESYARWLHLPVSSIEVIPNAVPVDTLRAMPEERGKRLRRDLGFEDDTFVVLMPARLVPEKGHRFFVDAMGRVARPDLRGVIVGRGPAEAAIAERIRARGLQDRVLFMPGGLSHSDTVALMSAVDLVVVPSIREGFGLAPAEAMALGTPVLASRVGGLTDLIEDGVSGLLVPPGEAGALARAIHGLSRNGDLRSRLGEGGRRRVDARFTTARVAKTWDRFYRSFRGASVLPRRTRRIDLNADVAARHGSEGGHNLAERRSRYGKTCRPPQKGRCLLKRGEPRQPRR